MYQYDSIVKGIPIGRPITNARIYILGGQGNPAPIGVTGEIYIAGAGVARGYLNRAEQTSERFTRDPFVADPQARMYRTGDLGRWRPDGNIEFIGRNDSQVKIRGYRIELGEIEAELARHPQVKEVMVLACADAREEAGDKRLVAYVVGRDEDARRAPSADALRTYLKASLPLYMVPSAFVMLERLPLTVNGKLDRRALPLPESQAHVSCGYEAAQGEVEEILAGICQDLLRVKQIGRQDNFFDLGGHSLIVTQLVDRIRSLFSIDLPIRKVFECRTVRELAAEVKTLVDRSVPEALARGGPEIEDLLEKVASMPESTIQELMREMERGVQP
jgi:arthrofactin-type cyclic lipopeptide synthetase C